MKKVVFILGTGHCGSTLLDLLLGGHPEAFSLGEVHRVLKADSSKKLCDLCDKNCSVWTKRLIQNIQNTYKLNLFQKVLSKISNTKKSEVKFYDEIFKATGKQVLIDSSKNSRWIKRNGDALYKSHKYETYLIYLSRDGRAVVNSLYRKNPNSSVKDFADKWNKKIIGINTVFENWSYSEKLHIRYEDLAQEPDETIQNILKLIDLNYEPSMMRFWEHIHHSINGNAGTKSLILKFQNQHRHHNIDWDLNKKGYYKNHELGIEFDERWKKELSIAQINEIEGIIGDYNKELIR